MRVAVTGATGVIGTAAVRALVAAGHQVIGSARRPEKADQLRAMGAEVAGPSIFDVAALAEMFDGCDAVCNVATHIPVGYAAALPGSWRENNRLRTEGVRAVVDAARKARVRRVVQESVSFIYADQGDDWITEESPLEISKMTEPVSVGETYVQEYRCGSRTGVVLRFGAIVGDDGLTRWLLRAARQGRPVGTGTPQSWAHVVHTDDLGSAVLAALSAPDGVYNVGAEPVRRGDLVQGFADAAGQQHATFVRGLTRRLAGARIEPMTRSLRVNSEHFVASTGWTPQRERFDASWLDVVAARTGATR